MIASKAEAPNFRKGNSQLLMDYREALSKSYKLGEDIKEIYGVVPPKVILEDRWTMPAGMQGNHVVVGLTVN